MKRSDLFAVNQTIKGERRKRWAVPQWVQTLALAALLPLAILCCAYFAAMGSR
jgi:hypothetical protein